MIQGLYTGASGMVAQMHRMDALSNNLANVDTEGYKKDSAVFKSFPELLLRRMNDDGVGYFPGVGSVDQAPVVGKLGTGVEMNEFYTDFTQGGLKQTDSDFDLALDGKGFFTIQTPEGVRYTRNGSFKIEKNGFLVTKEGNPVIGENGPIQLKRNNFMVDDQGRIYQNAEYAADPDRMVSKEENEWRNTELVDQLRIVDFDRTRYLQKQGDSMWRATNESGSGRVLQENRPAVKQGFLETSNVNPVSSMVQMIEVNRAYEASQKIIKSQDETLGKLINSAARM